MDTDYRTKFTNTEPRHTSGPNAQSKPERRRGQPAGDPLNDYCAIVQREALRLARRRHCAFEADDVAQRVVLKVLANPARTMMQFPDPLEFARAATRNAGLDHLRREQAQRGAGAEGGRTISSWDALTPSGATGDTSRFAATLDPAETALGSVGAAELLALVNDDLDREILERRALRSDRVTEIAADHGVNHATISRRLAATRRWLQVVLAADDYVRAS